MRFWDTSAVVPLLIEEPPWSRHYRQLLRDDPKMVVWAYTRTEATSAIQAHRRAGFGTAHQLEAAEKELDGLKAKWIEVDVSNLRARDEAERLLRTYVLRAADALQLGTALVAFGRQSRRRDFLTKDKALAQAAEAEGFRVR